MNQIKSQLPYRARFLCRFGLVSLSLVLVLPLISATCQKLTRRPIRYLIPDGYVGWVRVDYEIGSAPPLAIEDGYYLIKFPPTARIQTSTHMEEGYAKDQYYYYSNSNELKRQLHESGWGKGGMIWGEFNGRTEGEPGIYRYFFIGTEEQLKAFGWKEKDEHGNPKVGSIRPTQ